MNRKRLDNETFKQYRKNLKKEQQVLDASLQPTYLWRGYAPDPMARGRMRLIQGTATRNPARLLDKSQPHYIAA